MFAGHVGAALVFGRVDRRVNVGILITAAVLFDIVLWLLVLFGWESVSIPPDFAQTHQAEFTFPYSHGLLATIGWSALAAAAGFVIAGPLTARWRIAALLALAVSSHWFLDALVHAPELPLVGMDSPKVGLGLWRNMPAAMVAEAVIVAVGLALFLPGSGLSRGKAVALAILTLALLAFTVAGMTIAPPPPSATAMAASSLATLIVICALACWLGKVPRGRRA